MKDRRDSLNLKVVILMIDDFRSEELQLERAEDLSHFIIKLCFFSYELMIIENSSKLLYKLF